jgi:serine/threonine-protein phosphatase PGAM5
MFSFISSASKHLFSRNPRFTSQGRPSNILEAAIAASAIGGAVLLLGDNKDNDIGNCGSSILRCLLPATEKTLTESNESDDKSDNELLQGQCLKRQMRTPAVPYPLWDYNWDGRMTSDSSLESFRNGRANASSTKQKGSDGRYKGSKTGKTRHLLLVRHGQYDERREEDEHRKLTPLGRQQAIKTGKRLVEMARGTMKFEKDHFNGKCFVKAIHVSNMVRAKETAALIAKQFQEEKMTPQKPDPLLNEALPAPMIPIRPDIPGATEEIDLNHDRIEEAFQKYFYRDDKDDDSNVIKKAFQKYFYRDDGESNANIDNDEFEIIVCHGNVIRYFFCRALQLPPEAWLRMQTLNCSITYIVIRPNGMVSARMMGDIGHLDYDESTFSGKFGFKW